MFISDMEDDKTYEMVVDGEVRMIAKGDFLKKLIIHPIVVNAFEECVDTESCDSVIYREVF